jgi:hypothetical protein
MQSLSYDRACILQFEIDLTSAKHLAFLIDTAYKNRQTYICKFCHVQLYVQMHADTYRANRIGAMHKHETSSLHTNMFEATLIPQIERPYIRFDPEDS